MLEIPYTGRKGKRGDTFWTPRAVAHIQGPLGVMEGPATVDTGADTTHIPRQYAEQLAAQAGRSLDSFDHEWLTVSGAHDAADAMMRITGDWFATVQGIRVPIRPLIGRWSEDVFLGHDFLEHFVATFDGPARCLRLERAGDRTAGSAPTSTSA